MTVHGVAFDFDNTLADTLPAMATAINRVLSGLGISAEYRPEDLVGVNPLQLLRQRSAARAVSTYWRELRGLIPSLQLFPSVEETLDHLHKVTVLALQTSLPQSFLLDTLNHLSISTIFRRVVCHGDVARPKPAPDGLLAISDSLGVLPANLVYVGDQPIDIHTARAAGALSGAALWPRGDPKQLLDLRPDYAFRTPLEVLGIVKSPF